MTKNMEKAQYEFETSKEKPAYFGLIIQLTETFLGIRKKKQKKEYFPFGYELCSQCFKELKKEDVKLVKRIIVYRRRAFLEKVFFCSIKCYKKYVDDALEFAIKCYNHSQYADRKLFGVRKRILSSRFFLRRLLYLKNEMLNKEVIKDERDEEDTEIVNYKNTDRLWKKAFG